MYCLLCKHRTDFIILLEQCQTTHEEEIFEVQDKRSLFPLGWIHVSFQILCLEELSHYEICSLLFHNFEKIYMKNDLMSNKFSHFVTLVLLIVNIALI